MGQGTTPDRVNETFSHSSITTYRECPHKYWLSYLAGGNGITPTTPSTALQIGTLYHQGMELLLRKDLTAAEFVIDEYENTFQFGADPEERASVAAHVRGLLRTHAKKLDESPLRFSVVETEENFEIEIAPGQVFTGKKDGVVRFDNGLWLVEHKTYTFVDADLLSTIPSDGQVLRYTKAARLNGQPIVGVIYTIAKKCQIRGTKNESATDKNKRITEWYESEGPILHEIVRFGAGDVDRCWTGTLASIDQITKDRDFHRHENACRSKFGVCPFFSICMKSNWTEADPVPAGFRPKTSRHEELED